jgi:hypothetical protein
MRVLSARNARAASVAALLVASSLGVQALGCEPSERVPARGPKAPPCPPPPEPEYQAAVVGTIGKLHMVESGYPIAKLGDVLAAFKPDLVLVAVRVDAFREARFEEASFEMTYVNRLAKQHGVFVEPVDWFREEDLGAAPPDAEPWDEAELARKEGEILRAPRLYTFAQANGDELAQKVLLATASEARHRAGNPAASRRSGWMTSLTASAVSRHGRPKRVLAYVDVLDRPAVDMVLHGVGYTMKGPAQLLSKSKDEIIADISPEVMADWNGQLERSAEELAKAKTPGEKAFWADHQRTLRVAVDKRAACCVTQSAITAGK